MHSEMTGNPRTGLMTLVNQVYKAMNKRASEELLGMRLKQFLTLSYIQDHENVTQQELETTLLVDANAVVLLLNDLETAGYVVRRRDPADRRRHGRAAPCQQSSPRVWRRAAARWRPSKRAWRTRLRCAQASPRSSTCRPRRSC